MYLSEFSRSCIITGLLLLMVACGSANIKDQNALIEQQAVMVDTTAFLPVQYFDDKTQMFLVYEPKENPYLALKGRIDKEAVTKFIQARRYFKEKRYQECKALLEEVIAIDDGLAGPWVILGDIALAEEDSDEAQKFYAKSLEVNAKNINAYLKLAKLLREKGQYLKAQNVYAEALEVWPDFPEAHLNLGILYDIYLNHPLRAQKHMAAYQFLTKEEDLQVTQWLQEIEQRTGVKNTTYSTDKVSKGSQ